MRPAGEDPDGGPRRQPQRRRRRRSDGLRNPGELAVGDETFAPKVTKFLPDAVKLASAPSRAGAKV